MILTLSACYQERDFYVAPRIENREPFICEKSPEYYDELMKSLVYNLLRENESFTSCENKDECVIYSPLVFCRYTLGYFPAWRTFISVNIESVDLLQQELSSMVASEFQHEANCSCAGNRGREVTEDYISHCVEGRCAKFNLNIFD